MHKCSLALLHSKMSTLHAILDRLPQPMDNTPNTEQMFADENHDFIKLFNGNANYNDETEIHNDSLYPTDDTYCMYYTPDEVAQTIGNENNQLSIFSLNCRSINANWDSLNQLIYNVTTEHCRFDCIGLTEVFKFNDDFNYSIQGYHYIEYNTRDESDDGHGGVGIYINSNMSYFRRDDLSIFIPHVIETLFIEVKLNKTKSIIVGVIYRPNSQPRADMDIFTTELADITAKINNENKESYIMGDFNIDLLKFQSHEKTKYFIESMLTTGYLPVITKPTRVTDHSATLIDHIYSNSK